MDNRTFEQIDPDIFTVSHLFTREECLHFIQRAESIGFEAASVLIGGAAQMITKVRNNDRVAVTDPDLALEMWKRIEPFLPHLDGCGPSSVDSRLRFYRYFPGQQFKRHKDGYARNDTGETTKLSFLIYLNDDCEGGSTTFCEGPEKAEHVILPKTGSAVLFRHERWHAGTLVTTGAKYVLRSDVFYRQREESRN